MTDAEIAVGRLDSSDMAALLKIYEEALPPEERKPENTIRDCLRRSDYHGLAAHSPTGQLLGFAIIYVSRKYPFALLEYLATDRAARRTGVGTLMFNAVISGIKGRCLLVEVDACSHGCDPGEAAYRRHIFYRRLGCQRIIDLEYRMPKVNAENPPPMDLLPHRNGREHSIGRDELIAWLGDIFLHVYNRKSAQLEINAMMGDTKGVVAIM